MNLLLHIGLLIILAIIAYEDFKSRTISLWSLILLTLFAFANGLIKYSWQELGFHFLLNGLFFSIQLFVLKIYFSLKNKSSTNIADNYIGWGDIYYFIPLAFAMPLPHLVWFYVISLCLILLGTILCVTIKKTKEQTIPLAGLLSLCWAIYLLFERFN